MAQEPDPMFEAFLQRLDEVPEVVPRKERLLVIESDVFDVSVSRLRNETCSLRLNEFPRPLRDRLTCLIELLRTCDVTSVTYHERPEDNAFVISNDLPEATREVVTEARETLRDAAWYLTYHHVRLTSRDRKNWFCPDCDAEMAKTRQSCDTRTCPGRGMYARCTTTSAVVPFTPTQTSPTTNER